MTDGWLNETKSREEEYERRKDVRKGCGDTGTGKGSKVRLTEVASICQNPYHSLFQGMSRFQAWLQWLLKIRQHNITTCLILSDDLIHISDKKGQSYLGARTHSTTEVIKAKYLGCIDSGFGQIPNPLSEIRPNPNPRTVIQTWSAPQESPILFLLFACPALVCLILLSIHSPWLSWRIKSRLLVLHQFFFCWCFLMDYLGSCTWKK